MQAKICREIVRKFLDLGSSAVTEKMAILCVNIILINAYGSFGEVWSGEGGQQIQALIVAYLASAVALALPAYPFSQT